MFHFGILFKKRGQNEFQKILGRQWQGFFVCILFSAKSQKRIKRALTQFEVGTYEVSFFLREKSSHLHVSRLFTMSFFTSWERQLFYALWSENYNRVAIHILGSLKSFKPQLSVLRNSVNSNLIEKIQNIFMRLNFLGYSWHQKNKTLYFIHHTDFHGLHFRPYKTFLKVTLARFVAHLTIHTF